MMSFGRAVDDKTNPFFQTDPLIPIEYFEILKSRTCQDPERSLMLAVLEDAITCLEKYAPFGPRGNQRLYDEARDWILSDDCDWLFSFNNVCEAVGLHAGYLRRGLIEMSERRPVFAGDRTRSPGTVLPAPSAKQPTWREREA
jgi:hypothetical protein